MNMNVFTWIREGVRQSVILGVTDALDNIGAAPDGDDLKARLSSTLVRRDADQAPAANLQTPNRAKRLGRSLKDIELEG